MWTLTIEIAVTANEYLNLSKHSGRRVYSLTAKNAHIF